MESIYICHGYGYVLALKECSVISETVRVVWSTKSNQSGITTGYRWCRIFWLIRNIRFTRRISRFVQIPCTNLTRVWDLHIGGCAVCCCVTMTLNYSDVIIIKKTRLACCLNICHLHGISRSMLIFSTKDACQQQKSYWIRVSRIICVRKFRVEYLKEKYTGLRLSPHFFRLPSNL